MSLPKKYDKRMKSGLGMRAVWLPGAHIDLGAVLLRDEGVFNPGGSVTDFGATIQKQALAERNLKFTSAGTKTRVFQFDAEVPSLGALDSEAEASAEVSFDREYSYMLRTPLLNGETIKNLLAVARKVASNPDWNHGKYFFAWKVLRADEFTFLGSEESNRTLKFSGKGSSIAGLLNIGLSADVKKTGSVGVEVLGSGGDVAMGVARVRKNGQLDFV